MAKDTQTKGSIWYVKVLLLLVVANIALYVGGAWVAYPTQAHRDTAHRLSEMTSDVNFSPDVYDSTSYKSLSSSAEARYTTMAGMVLIAVDIALTIALIGLTYNYIRKNRVVKSGKEALATALINVGAALLAWLITLGVVSSISGTATPSLTAILFMTIAFITVGFVVCYLFARLAQWQYNRKHSVVV